MRHCLRDATFSRFDKTATCDRQTDIQTDGRTQEHSIYRASIASRGKNLTDATNIWINDYFV